MAASMSRRLKTAYRLVTDVVHLGHSAEAWTKRLGDGLVEIFDARMVGMAWAHLPDRPGEFIGSEVELHHGFTPEESRRWSDAYYGPNATFQSEVLRRIINYPARFVTLRRQDVISDEEWYAARTTQEVHRPLGIDQVLNSHFVALSMRRIFGVALHRAWGKPEFEIDDRRLLRRIHLELARAWRRRISTPEEDPAICNLPPRLRQVLWLLCLGRSEKEIALHLDLSAHTVHNHVQRLHRELSVRSRAELLSRALTSQSSLPFAIPGREMTQFKPASPEIAGSP
jgi:DNA-binding CsgD family transcriptional regulator